MVQLLLSGGLVLATLFFGLLAWAAFTGIPEELGHAVGNDTHRFLAVGVAAGLVSVESLVLLLSVLEGDPAPGSPASGG